MAEIFPFPGIHYSPQGAPLSEVIAPPYDVLSPEQQEELHLRHPENFVRVMLNHDEIGDDASTNRYTRAAETMQQWLDAGILVQDDQPALYEYIQRFEHPLEPTIHVERQTLFVALKLEPYEKGVVLPHEETHPKAKTDRLNLMRTTQANPEPIYGLYEDPTLTVGKSLRQIREGEPPFLRAKYPGKFGGVEEHLIYRHTDACLLDDIQEYFLDRRVWIADGHHRYETALNYQKERRAALSPEAAAKAHAFDSILIGLSAFEDPGLVVLPTHRLVKNLSEDRLETLELHLERFFHVEKKSVSELRIWMQETSPDEKRFGVIGKNDSFALTLRDLKLVQNSLDDTHCAAWKNLDVTILQTFVLDRTLGISWTELAHTTDVAYTRDEEEAVQKALSGEFQLALLLQNPTVTEVREVASAGDKMPQKSTFFYPKLWSGLILRRLED